MNREQKLSKELIDFIAASPSAFHVTDNLCHMLDASGYIRLSEGEDWTIKPSSSYYVTRNDSSIIAFTIPKKATHFQIVAAHSDSPTFRIKTNPEITVENCYIKLNTERYGGMLMAPWFDRPLSVAGRIIVRDKQSLVSKLVNIDRDLLMIPNLAIHMNRNANDGASFNAQTDMLPLMGLASSKQTLAKLISKETGISDEDIVATDLFLYNREKGTIWGASKEFMSAPKLDDLLCAYCGITSLIASSNTSAINVCCVFDNEEVGSTTKQGADSSFLSDTLERVAEALKITHSKLCAMIARSFMLSADNAHAVHPNHPEVADPTNRPTLNKGVVIKINANQRYTTDAVSMAVFSEICKKAKVPTQTFVNRSDIAGGSTLGNISNSHISLNTVDIGAPQLAMHSPYETSGVMDTLHMQNAMKAFFNSEIEFAPNGTINI